MYLLIIPFLLVFYSLYIFINRVYLSPISHVPGPKLAIWSFWYEFYYDVVLKGRYTFQLLKLHETYGPIIRINPYEVHINDPDFYDEVYVNAGKRRSEQWSWTVPMFGTPNSILATIDHDVHRRRRGAFANFFSKGRIREYSSVVQSCVDKLCNRISEHAKQGKKINLMHAWTAFTGDVVTAYSFPASYGLLDQPDFAPEYYELWVSIVGNSHILKQFPWLFPLMNSFPLWFVERYLPDLAVSYRWHKTWAAQIQATKTGADEAGKRGGRKSIFETLLDSDLPPYDKSVSRLVEDAQTLVGAGSITTSIALSLATYYIITSPSIQDRLISELHSTILEPDVPSPLVELEKLDYLSAVVLEALRISYGVSHRLQRVCPDQAIQYHDIVIPAGTPVSMTSVHIHDNPAIFPEPRTFKPERWLPLETEGKRLEKYFVAFSRGSRQCLGMHLGSAELYLGLAGLFRKFGVNGQGKGGMRIVDTVYERDVNLTHDVFTPSAKPESKGICVMVDH